MSLAKPNFEGATFFLPEYVSGAVAEFKVYF